MRSDSVSVCSGIVRMVVSSADASDGADGVASVDSEEVESSGLEISRYCQTCEFS